MTACLRGSDLLIQCVVNQALALPPTVEHGCDYFTWYDFTDRKRPSEYSSAVEYANAVVEYTDRTG